jgi:hypothetical protein
MFFLVLLHGMNYHSACSAGAKCDADVIVSRGVPLRHLVQVAFLASYRVSFCDQPVHVTGPSHAGNVENRERDESEGAILRLKNSHDHSTCNISKRQ